MYALVDRESFVDRTQVPDLVAKRLKVLDFIAGRLRDPKFTKSYQPGEVDVLTARLEQARKAYRTVTVRERF